MDYGKLAYLKAVDLEDKLGYMRSEKFCVTTIELNELVAGENFLAQIDGDGDIAVFVSASSVGTFFVDGVKVCEGADVFFKMTDGGELTAVFSEEHTKVRIMALGDITAAETSGKLYADYDENEISYLVCDRGTVKAYKSPKLSFEPRLLFETKGLQGDVCEYKKEFVFAILSEDGSVALRKGDIEKAYPLGASAVAISGGNYSLMVAYVSKGRLYVFELGDVGEEIASQSNVYFTGAVDDVRFVKKGSKVLFSSGGKCYAKELGADFKYDDKLYVRLATEVL